MNHKFNKPLHDDPSDIFVRDTDPMLARDEIYRVPDGFFASEKARIKAMGAGYGLGRRMRMRRIVRISALAAACLAFAILIPVAISLSGEKSEQAPPAPQQQLAAAAHHSEIAGNKSQTTPADVSASADNSSWTQTDEAESADVLLWLY